MMRKILETISKLLPNPRVIFDRDGTDPYLSRWYLLGRKPSMPDGSSPFDEKGAARAGILQEDGGNFAVYLHRFHRGDDAEELHNHLWQWSIAIVLAGGYIETRKYTDHDGTERVFAHTMEPPAVNFILSETFHRVTLIEEDSWSIFIAGPRMASWGFWDRHTKVFTNWREYVARRRGVDPGTFGDAEVRS